MQMNKGLSRWSCGTRDLNGTSSENGALLVSFSRAERNEKYVDLIRWWNLGPRLV